EERISCIFTQKELADILNHVRTDLIMRLDEQLDNWDSNYTTEQDPDEYFAPLIETLKDYRKIFDRDSESAAKIDDILAEIDSVLDELRPEYRPTSDFNSDAQHLLNDAI